MGTGDSSSIVAPPPGSAPPDIPGYRILRTVGAGGMGSVYAVEQLSTHQLFALKLILGRHSVDASFVQRFEREVGALREIRHPNVVQVFAWHLPQDSSGPVPPYLVMELLRGEGLDQLLRREPRLPPGRTVALMLQVLDAIAAAHRIGVLHRDIGPGNVFLVPQPEGGVTAKVLDFGLARVAGGGPSDGSDLTQPGTVLGKPGYIAPELLLDRSADERVDVFACGMLLYRMLTGRLPFSQKKAELLWAERFAERANTNEYPPPSQFVPEVPDVLDAIVARAVRRRPEDRYPTAREMQDSLLAAEPSLPDRVTVATLPSSPAAGEVRSVTAVAAGTTELVAGVRRRRRRGLGLAAAVLGLLAATGAVVWWFAVRTPDDSSPSTTAEAAQPVVAADAGAPAGPDAAVAVADAAAAARDPAEAASVAAAAEAAEPAPVTDAGPDAAAAPARMVRVSFAGLPRDAKLLVDGHEVTGSSVHLPASDAFLAFEVQARGFEPYHGSFSPSADQELKVELTARGRRPPTRDGGGATARRDAGTLEGRAGATFVTEYDEP
jgi:serine/threonine-protein kinase